MFQRPAHAHASEWRPARVGGTSWWRHVEDGEGVTVFESEDGWKWVYDSEFSEPFDTLNDAMLDAEEELGL